MKFLIDMNLSPQWITVLGKAGFEAVHWSAVGKPNVSDREIMTWARSNGYVVFTHDLDYGAILAATKTECPSVIQIRTQDISPQTIGDLVISVIKQFHEHLQKGALISIDEKKLRARILPLND
jgi:predicted nuclease of predicted toxin-antitoxin system